MRVDVYTAMNHLQLRQVFFRYLKNRLTFVLFEKLCVSHVFSAGGGVHPAAVRSTGRTSEFIDEFSYRRGFGIDDNRSNRSFETQTQRVSDDFF